MRHENTLCSVVCRDSLGAAAEVCSLLLISRTRAMELGESAIIAMRQGWYLDGQGRKVDVSGEVSAAVKAVLSLPPEAPLPVNGGNRFAGTLIEVCNETTLQAAFRLQDEGESPLVLNFANGISPGGGFLKGALAQEEALCRSSALFLTLVGKPMYQFHRLRPEPDSTDWAMLSPAVPVFRTDFGVPLDRPRLLDFITCAAPVARSIGLEAARKLLAKRIHRVLAVARAYGFRELVLGAWGCGAFGNDPEATARDFRVALTGEFAGAFARIVFAIADWSPERRFLGPFQEVFAPLDGRTLTPGTADQA